MDEPTDIRFRRMTPDELRGYNHALDCMKLWGSQIETGMRAAPTTGIAIPFEKQQINSARMVCSLAEALKRGTARLN